MPKGSEPQKCLYLSATGEKQFPAAKAISDRSERIEQVLTYREGGAFLLNRMVTSHTPR